MADMNIRYEELLAHRKGQPAYAAVLGGVDALVFTAGIGENDAQLRAKVVAKLAWMGRKARTQAQTTAMGRASRPRTARSRCG